MKTSGIKEAVQSILIAVEAAETKESTAPAPEPKPAHHAPVKIGMLEEAPGVRSVKRVVYFFSFLLGAVVALVAMWRGDGSTARDIVLGLVGLATGGAAVGWWAEVQESKISKDDKGESDDK
jgi:hypothetical protein